MNHGASGKVTPSWVVSGIGSIVSVFLACQGNIEGPAADDVELQGGSASPPGPGGGGGASMVGGGGVSTGGVPGTAGTGGTAPGCPIGQASCGGVCVGLATDNLNCGACGTVCAPGTVCTSGACQCAPGTVLCGAACVNVATDPSNCGTCGHACAAAEVCANGGCATSCPDAQTQCGQSCVDLTSDEAHCGGCDEPCEGALTCSSGSCGCSDGLTACGGQCVDTESDNSNCGDCGEICSGGQTCAGGDCQCPGGLTLCGGACVDTDTDLAHCGGCDEACTTSCDCGDCRPAATGLIGWASVSGNGLTTTTGGDGGSTVDVDSASELSSAAGSSTKQIIRISGSISIEELTINSNKTLVGADANATIVGGLRIDGESNVVIQNLKVNAKSSGANGDGIRITNSHHVWIDHVEVWDAPDGNLDISEASNYVTVSWSKFWYSTSPGASDHRFSNLIGGSDSATGDENALNVTFHHNWWADRVHERMPRVRFGDVHVFNNYYSSSGNNYCIRAGYHSKVLVENNYFEDVDNPHEIDEDSGTGQIKASGNVYDGTSGAKDTSGGAFTPPYTYTLDAASGIPAAVKAGAGPH